MKFYWKIPIIFIIYLFVTFITSLIGGFIAGIDFTEFTDPQYEPTLEQLPVLTAFTAIAGIITLKIYTKGLDKNPFPKHYFGFAHFKRDSIRALLFTNCALLSGVLILLISKQISISYQPISHSEFVNTALLFIAVAFSEEIFSRGIIQKVLMDSLNPYIALLIAALLFAIMHAWNDHLTWIGLLNLFLAGIFLGIVFMRTENLWFAIIAHFLWNFLQSPILGLNVSGMELPALFKVEHLGNSNISGGEFGFEGSLICSVVLIIAIYFLDRKYQKHLTTP